jgi:uncharacterized protein YjiS (DUF1127 family)
MKTIISWPNPLNIILQGLRRRRTINELSALPDHLLADIGIERDAIPSVVNGLLKTNTTMAGNRPLIDPQITTAENDLLLLSRV